MKSWSPSLRRGRMVSRGATVDVAGQRVRDVDANVIGRLLKCSALVRLDLSVRLFVPLSRFACIPNSLTISLARYVQLDSLHRYLVE